MIVAFVGFKQVGKSTAAKYLEDKYGFVRHNFKDALVAEIKEKFPDLLRAIADTEYIQHFGGQIDALFVNKPPLMRALMQNYGTEVRRGDDPFYWSDKWLRGLPEGNVVVDDLRFMTELTALRQNPSVVVRLTRPDIPTGGDHRSETEQLQIEADYTIECEAGDFDRLYTELDRIVEIHK